MEGGDQSDLPASAIFSNSFSVSYFLTQGVTFWEAVSRTPPPAYPASPVPSPRNHSEGACTVLLPLSLVTPPRLSSQWPCVNCECYRSADSFQLLSFDLHPSSPNLTQGNQVIWLKCCCCCCSVMSDSAIPLTAALQASLSFTISWILLRLMSIESVMPSNHLILCQSPSSPALNLSQHQGLDSTH